MRFDFLTWFPFGCFSGVLDESKYPSLNVSERRSAGYWRGSVIGRSIPSGDFVSIHALTSVITDY